MPGWVFQQLNQKGTTAVAGHIQDRWWRDKKDPDTGEVVLNAKGRPVREKTDLYGIGLRYKVRYYDPDGIERNKSFPDKQLGKAQDFLTKMQHDVLAGVFIDADAGKVKFRDYAENWLKGQSQDAKTRQTLNGRLRNQLNPFFGHKSLAAINAEVVRDWLEWLREKNLEASTQAVSFDTLSSIMSAAVDDKKIRSNPCKAQSVKKPKRIAKKIVPWSEGRLRAIQLALPSRFKIAATLGAGVGMRQGEVLGFSPDDINREELVVNVVRQIRLIGKQLVFAPPKGGKERVVPLGQGVLDAVDAYQKQFEPISVTLPWKEPGGRPVTVRLLIAVNSTGRLYSGQAFHEVVWKPAFKRAGLVYTAKVDGSHALRHLYASLLLALGVSIKELADYLGHADPGFTLRTYTHLMPSSHKRARAAVDSVFRPQRAEEPRTA